jgi:hypothetical protein
MKTQPNEITNKIKNLYDTEGKGAAIKWIIEHPNKKIDGMFGKRTPSQEKAHAEARLEAALELYPTE